MGLFGKNKARDNEAPFLNQLFSVAIEFNQSTGNWTELPTDVPDDLKTNIINTRKIVFEYIRQLREAHVYSNGAVKKFIKEDYPWMNKETIQKVIKLGQLL
jgi:hypothetical protein